VNIWEKTTEAFKILGKEPPIENEVDWFPKVQELFIIVGLPVPPQGLLFETAEERIDELLKKIKK
jgi:hypothetical protein